MNSGEAKKNSPHVVRWFSFLSNHDMFKPVYSKLKQNVSVSGISLLFGLLVVAFLLSMFRSLCILFEQLST